MQDSLATTVVQHARVYAYVLTTARSWNNSPAGSITRADANLLASLSAAQEPDTVTHAHADVGAHSCTYTCANTSTNAA